MISRIPSIHLAGLLAAMLFFATPAWGRDAGSPSQEQEAAWQGRLDEARALQDKADSVKAQAKRRLDSEKKACFSKFQVYACQNEAKQRYVEAMKDVRKLENEGGAIEREVKKARLADRDTRQEADAPRREQELKDKEAATQAGREAAAARQEKRLADKEAKARDNGQRREKDAARLREKQEKHDKMVAEKLEKARRREADGDR